MIFTVEGKDGAAVSSRQRRRKTLLEAVELVVPAAWAVYVSGRLVARWDQIASVTCALIAGLVLTTYWIWHRRRFPANVAATDGASIREKRERPTETRSIWAWDNLLLVVFIALAWVVTVVVGLLVAFMLPLAIVVGFAVFEGGADGSSIWMAMLLTLGVAVVIDVGIVYPLARHWALPMEGARRAKADFCPPPTGDGSR